MLQAKRERSERGQEQRGEPGKPAAGRNQGPRS